MAKRGLEIKVDGLKDLAERFADLSATGQARVKRAINENAVEFQRKVRGSIRKNTGRHRKYVRQNPKRGQKKLHWSSKPGMPPNSDSGKLAGSIEVTQRAMGRRNYVVVKAGGPGAKYAKALEKARDRRRRRPFMGPMFRKLRPVFVSRIRRAMMSAI